MDDQSGVAWADQTSTQRPKFHLFKSLPPELRIMIWRMAALRDGKEIFEMKGPKYWSELPGEEALALFKVKMDKTRRQIAQVCRESWHAIRGSPESIDWPLTPLRICMNPKFDSLLLHGDISFDKLQKGPKRFVGKVQHLLITNSESSDMIILDEIPASAKSGNGFLSSVKTISIVLETFRVPLQANALIRKYFSAELPFTVDLDDFNQIFRMAELLNGAWGDGENRFLTLYAAFIWVCGDFQKRFPECCARVRQRIQDAMATTDLQDYQIPDIKRVLLIRDQRDPSSSAKLLSYGWALKYIHLN